MPKLNAEHLAVITQAGDLMQGLIESGNLEEGTDKRVAIQRLVND